MKMPLSSILAIGIVLWLLIALLIFSKEHFALGINQTKSVPYTFFILKKSEQYHCKNYVSFQKSTESILPDNTIFIKEVAGIPGDKIEHIHGKLIVNQSKLGGFKSSTQDGKRLTPGFKGVIPDEFTFVYSNHPDSFDSRYREMGLIHESEIIACAYPLF